MIIFDLDGTLADCEHRRHFVDRDKASELGICYEDVEITFGGVQNGPWVLTNDCDRLWKPDWQTFYEACNQDTPIEPVIQIFRNQMQWFKNLADEINWEIWSGRCESVREKTEYWINNHVIPIQWNSKRLKMRPIGDSRPDDQLKEKWLDEALADGKTIDMVFDDRSKVVQMWRRRGIFVFDCNQSGKEF